MIGLGVAEMVRGMGIGENIFNLALNLSEGKPVIVESTNPAVHHLCEKYGLKRKSDIKFWDEASKLRLRSYRQIKAELDAIPGGNETKKKVLAGFTDFYKYRWYASI